MGALLVSPLTLCRSSSHHVDPALAADVHAQAFRDQLERVNPAPKVPDGRIESSKSVGGSSRRGAPVEKCRCCVVFCRTRPRNNRPLLFVAGLCWVGNEPYRFRHLRARGQSKSAFRRPSQLRAAAPESPLLASLREHTLFRCGRRALVYCRLVRGGPAAP